MSDKAIPNEHKVSAVILNGKAIQVTGRNISFGPAVKKLNPHLFTVGGMEAESAKRHAVSTLDGRLPKPKGGKASVQIRVTIVALRRRLLDPDAVAYACKSLTDAISEQLRLDDADPRIMFEYFQNQTHGDEGCVVKVSMP